MGNSLLAELFRAENDRDSSALPKLRNLEAATRRSGVGRGALYAGLKAYRKERWTAYR